jgi:hypothetical protein
MRSLLNYRKPKRIQRKPIVVFRIPEGEVFIPNEKGEITTKNYMEYVKDSFDSLLKKEGYLGIFVKGCIKVDGFKCDIKERKFIPSELEKDGILYHQKLGWTYERV